YSFNARDNHTQDNVTGKMDYQLSSSHSFTGAFHLVRNLADRPDVGNFVTAVGPVTNDDKIKLFSGSWRWILSPRMINEVRGGANIAPGTFAVAGTPPAFFEANSSVLWTSPVNEFLPQGRFTHTFNLGDNLSYIMGKHSLQMGGSLQMVRIH